MIAKKVGKLRCGILQKNGEKLIVTLENVNYVPELWINLFSIGKALKKGFNLSNDGEIIMLSKGNVTLTFDKVVRTKNGFVHGIKLLQVLDDVGTSVLETKKRNTIDVNNLHKILGHCSEVNTRLTGKAYGYEVTGKFDVCEACSVAKVRKKNMKKERKGGSSIRGERLYVDISSVKGTSFGRAKFWELIIDDFSSHCWSYFLKKKDELKDKVVKLIKELKNENIQVKFLRLDDAGENRALEKECTQQNLAVKFEYSGPHTPQRNGKFERKFQTLYGRIRAMMNDSDIDGEFHDGLWAECTSTATYYDNLIINKDKKKSSIELMFKSRAKGLMNLERFGEMFVATTKNKVQGKLSDKGIVCVFVGYAVNHADDVYRLLNPKKKNH
jgi:hypothetical protein